MKFKDIKPFTSDGNYKVNMSFDYLIQWLQEQQAEYGLNLNPDFQRGHVWTEEQQVAWLEHVIRGGKNGLTLYFNDPYWMSFCEKTDEYHDFVCVDGLQRITAIHRFMGNELMVFGSLYKEFEDPFWLRNNISLEVVVNNLKSRREVLQWYIDMNTGGTPHPSSEIERVRALMEGKEDVSVKERKKDIAIDLTNTTLPCPLCIIEDRYSGAYSEASYLAFNMEPYQVWDHPVNAGDINCQQFWNNEDDFYPLEDSIIGKGSTPEEALKDLINQLKEKE